MSDYSDAEIGGLGSGPRYPIAPPHRCWRDAKRGEWCDCPIPGDHNPSAWRSRQVLDEIGCPCDRKLALHGIHDSFLCPLGIWVGPLGVRELAP